MAIHTADAIVLRRYPYRETSVIVSCLTDRHGKLKGIVKGLRASPQRYRSAMEPLTLNRIVFYDTRASQLHLISQCELQAPYEQLQQDLDTARTAAFCVDLADAVVPLEEPQPATFRLLKETLERLSLRAGGQESLRVHFTLRLLRLAGFHPQLGECTGCGGVVRDSGYWSAKQGGLLCARCLHEDPQAEADSPELLDALEHVSHSVHPPILETTLVAALRRRLDEFLHWRLEKPLRTMRSLA